MRKLKHDIISVIMPVHNSGKFLPECLDSLRSQSYKKLQVIAIDDDSKDNSYSVLKKYQKRYKKLEVYKNVKYYGLATCYNRAIKRAKGQFLAFLSPNDINHPNRFKRQIEFLLKNPKTVAVGTQFTSINEKNKKLERSRLPHENEEIYDNLLPSSSIQPETVMVNRTLLPKDLIYFKSNKFPTLFTEIFVKFFQYGAVSNIKHVLYFRRIGVKRHYTHQSPLRRAISMAKLWAISRSDYDYRPSLRNLLSPFIRPDFN